MNKFAEFQNFILVADTGSISKAAERLGIAKSAVSRRLAELEQRLGVQLFHRTTRRIKLTNTGQSFYQQISRIISDLNEIEESVKQAHSDLSGTLRIAAPLSFGLLHLAPAIIEFKNLHQQIAFDIDFNDREVDLIHEGFDLALRIAKLPDSSFIARKLATINNVVCASPDYLHKYGTPEHPQELNQHQCLVYKLLQSPYQWTFENKNRKPFNVKITPSLQANNGEFLQQAAIAGKGIVHQPLFIASQAIEQGLLSPILQDFTCSDNHLWALYPQTRHLSQRVRAFIDYLANLYANTPYWELCLQH